MGDATDGAERRLPWNRGRLLGQTPPLKLREVWVNRIRLEIAERLRGRARRCCNGRRVARCSSN